MVIFDVVITVCAMGACTEVRIPKSGEHFPSPFECAHYGQMTAYEFMKKYPRLTLSKFGCERHKEKT